MANFARRVTAAYLFCCIIQVQSIIELGSSAKAFASSYLFHQQTIDTVTLTQRGYLQFLRYIVDVPPLAEYTFCIWLRSTNFSYAHPILSYSKHEEERLIRVWISPHGHYINLEILQVPIFSFPVYFREHYWIHVCQSWSSYTGGWALYINGNVAASGFETQLIGAKIKGGGDIVIGQEYTDFDKGLEDGIEGDVFGFNFVLASTPAVYTNPSSHHIARRRNSQQPPTGSDYYSRQINANGKTTKQPLKNQNGILRRHYRENGDKFSLTQKPAAQEDVPSVLGYFNGELNRRPRNILGMFENMLSFFRPEQGKGLKTMEEFNAEQDYKYARMFKNIRQLKMPQTHQEIPGPHSRILHEYPQHNTFSSLGLSLVEHSYNCVLGKGAPLSGDKVLVSWTKTTVRVFGGAILRPVLPFCINH